MQPRDRPGQDEQETQSESVVGQPSAQEGQTSGNAASARQRPSGGSITGTQPQTDDDIPEEW